MPRRSVATAPSELHGIGTRRCLARPRTTGNLVGVLAEEANGRHAASTPRKTPLLIVGGILVLIAVGVLLFVLTGGSDGPLGQAVGGGAPDTPAFEFKLSKPKVVVTAADAKPKEVQAAAATAAKGATEALDTFYTEAFLDPANWQDGQYDDAFGAFTPRAAALAERQLDAMTAGSGAGEALTSIVPLPSTLKVRVLIDPKGLAYSTVGVVTFRAKGTGDAGIHMFVSKGQYILQKVDGEWTVVSFSVGRDDAEKAPTGSTSSSPSEAGSS